MNPNRSDRPRPAPGGQQGFVLVAVLVALVVLTLLATAIATTSERAVQEARENSDAFEAEVAKLNSGYLGGLDRKLTEEKAAGHLDNVLAIEAEKKLIPIVGRLGETAAGDSQSRPTTAAKRRRPSSPMAWATLSCRAASGWRDG